MLMNLTHHLLLVFPDFVSEPDGKFLYQVDVKQQRKTTVTTATMKRIRSLIRLVLSWQHALIVGGHHAPTHIHRGRPLQTKLAKIAPKM